MENPLIDISIPLFEWFGAYGLLAKAITATAYSSLTHMACVDPGDVETRMTNPDITDATSAFEKEKKGVK